MKGIIFLVLMTSALISCSSLYDAKNDAKDAVNKKYEEAKSLLTKIKSDILTEKEKKDENGLRQAKDILSATTTNTKAQLEKNVKDAVRTAIAKGKPLQAIDCIENTLLDGENIISNTITASNTNLENVLAYKQKNLTFWEAEVNLISVGLKELMDQALRKIDDMKNGYETVVVDASKKVDSAKKQLHEIETRVPQPLLSNEYVKVRKIIENKYKEISDNLFKRLQKCVA